MQRQILFVDDEQTILDVLAAVFRSAGYSALCTMDGREALEIVRREHIRVCFVDLRMPAMDGMELCRRIKEIEPSALVHALSAFVDAYRPEQYCQAGFEGCFRKPFKIDALLEAARAAFEKLEKLNPPGNGGQDVSGPVGG
jgi:CheY-like chemotaxis protein